MSDNGWILRCSDGHLYRAAPWKAVLCSAHLGTRRYTRCPVDRRWRLAARVEPIDLTDDELAEADAHRL